MAMIGRTSSFIVGLHQCLGHAHQHQRPMPDAPRAVCRTKPRSSRNDMYTVSRDLKGTNREFKHECGWTCCNLFPGCGVLARGLSGTNGDSNGMVTKSKSSRKIGKPKLEWAGHWNSIQHTVSIRSVREYIVWMIHKLLAEPPCLQLERQGLVYLAD